MATKNIRMRPEGSGDYGDILHPETNADQIIETTTAKVMTADERTKLAGIEAGAEVNDVTSVAGRTGAVTLTAADIGAGTLPEVTAANNNTSYTTKQLRNIILSTADPSGGSNGDVWIKYTP